MSELVLIVDDEPGILTTLSSVLNDEGFETVCTQSGDEAVQLYREKSPAVVFLDIWLPDRDGLEALQDIREMDPAAAVVMMSGHGTTSTAVKAIKMGAFDYVEKPVSYNQVVESVQGALEYRQSVVTDSSLLSSLERTKPRVDSDFVFEPAPELPLLQNR